MSTVIADGTSLREQVPAAGREQLLSPARGRQRGRESELRREELKSPARSPARDRAVKLSGGSLFYANLVNQRRAQEKPSQQAGKEDRANKNADEASAPPRITRASSLGGVVPGRSCTF